MATSDDGSNGETSDYQPRSYQMEALAQAIQKNTIVFLETGSGKTLIAIMLLRHYAYLLKKPSPSIAVFLVPTVVLVKQQADYVRKHLALKVEEYWGEKGVDNWNAAVWKKQQEENQLMVMTPDILRNALSHSFLTLDVIKVLIFDECHNAKKNHAYAIIMKEYYHRALLAGSSQVPRILGMTASPIKAKVSNSSDENWRQISELENLLRSKAIHKATFETPNDMAKRNKTGVWGEIISINKEVQKTHKSLTSIMRKQVGDGLSTKFWKHRWFGDRVLTTLFPNLYNLEGNKNCTVADRITQESDGFIRFNWSWKRRITTQDILNDINDLEMMISCYRFKEGHDKWIWGADDSQEFTTRSCRSWIDKPVEIINNTRVSWSRWIPIKVICFLWRALQNRIAVATSLIIRGVQLQHSACSLCSLEHEDVDHIFIRCPFSKEIWRRISWWMELDVTQKDSLKEMVSHNSGTVAQQNVWTTIIYATIWYIWKARNNWIFSKIRISTDQLVEDVKVEVFSWITNRGRKKEIVWTLWCNSPMIECGNWGRSG